jgi:hypothetical protein
MSMRATAVDGNGAVCAKAGILFFLIGVQRWTCTSHLHIAWDTQSVGIERKRIKT